MAPVGRRRSGVRSMRAPATRRRLLGSSRPWRAAAYLLVVAALPALADVALLLAFGRQLAAAVSSVGAVLVAYLLLALAASTPLQRRPVAVLGWPVVADPHVRLAERDGPARAWFLRWEDRTTGRERLHAVPALLLAPLDALVLLAAAVCPLLLAVPLLGSAGAVVVGPVTVVLTVPDRGAVSQ